MRSFKSVVLLQARTLQYAVEHGLNPIGIIHHLKFLATKAYAASYKPEAFIGYDERVRQKADREGISAFSDISHEDVLLHFCHKNVVFRKKSKKKSEGAKKKSGQKYCNNFNDAECSYKNCVFVHCSMIQTTEGRLARTSRDLNRIRLTSLLPRMLEMFASTLNRTILPVCLV